MTITFRRLVDADLPMLHGWLNDPGVVAWWEGDDVSWDAVVRDYGSAAEDSTEHWIASLDGVDIGWIQCYPAVDEPAETEPWFALGVSRSAAGIDYLIGEPSARGKGVGSAMVRAFVVDVVFGLHPEWSQVCAAPYAANEASWRALAKAGFRFVGTIDDEDGPCRLMCLDREGIDLLPADVLDDVAGVVGAEVTVLRRLTGGLNGITVRVRLAGGADAVLKAVPLAHPDHLAETLRAQRIVEHMRERNYPTPAWLGVGATGTHVWHLMDVVDAAPAPELTTSLIEQLMEIIELQAGQASEPYDHWTYAWLVATGQESDGAGPDYHETPEQLRLRRSVARVSEHSPAVSALVERLRLLCADVPRPGRAPDMVHADLATPGNVLVRDGAVVAVVDIGNAGSGTRAEDLVALVWYTFGDPVLDGVRRRMWTRILDLVGWEAATALVAAHLLHMLEIPIRRARDDLVPDVLERSARALDELRAITDVARGAVS